jgi:hypothetical protein
MCCNWAGAYSTGKMEAWLKSGIETGTIIGTNISLNLSLSF